MLTRWDPFREMMSLRSAMDRMIENSLGTGNSWSQPVSWDLALDVVENTENFMVRASVPGVKPDDIEITFTDNVLTIKGEVKSDKEISEDQYHMRERRYGSFSRSISLPNRIKSDAISATYDSGVLTLTLPKVEEVKPRRIQIQGSAPKVIEAKLSNN